jgi:beta-alanine--pyruvate transaminase
VRIIGRERGYHGVGFGGISVGGMSPNRKWFGPLLPGVDHLSHTYNRDQQAFTKGQPEWGATWPMNWSAWCSSTTPRPSLR